MKVRIKSVEPHGSIASGEGVVVAGKLRGRGVSFVGEFRMLADIAEALDAGEEVIADVPEWAVTDCEVAPCRT